MAPSDSPPKLDEDSVRRIQYKKKLRRKRRLDRESAEEIEGLNIYPMLDMMTIILVFLLKSYSASSVTLNGTDNVSPPTSSTTATPKETVAIMISGQHIMLDNKAILALQPDGRVNPADKEGGADGMLIPVLKAQLDKKVEQLKRIAQFNTQAPFTGELSVIADQHVPYRVLMEVLYTAGQAELSNYRFIVIQSEGSEQKPASG